jgi:hypothetical protein
MNPYHFVTNVACARLIVTQAAANTVARLLCAGSVIGTKLKSSGRKSSIFK